MPTQDLLHGGRGGARVAARRDKKAEPALHGGISSVVLSPRAKQEILEMAQGDVFRKARELEQQLDLAEQGLL